MLQWEQLKSAVSDLRASRTIDGWPADLEKLGNDPQTHFDIYLSGYLLFQHPHLLVTEIPLNSSLQGEAILDGVAAGTKDWDWSCQFRHPKPCIHAADCRCTCRANTSEWIQVPTQESAARDLLVRYLRHRTCYPSSPPWIHPEIYHVYEVLYLRRWLRHHRQPRSLLLQSLHLDFGHKSSPCRGIHKQSSQLPVYFSIERIGVSR